MESLLKNGSRILDAMPDFRFWLYQCDARRNPRPRLFVRLSMIMPRAGNRELVHSALEAR